MFDEGCWMDWAVHAATVSDAAAVMACSLLAGMMVDDRGVLLLLDGVRESE